MTIQAPSKKELKTFGLIMAAFIALVLALVLPKVTQWQVGYWPWGLVLFFVLTAFLVPRFLAPIFSAWVALGSVLGRINTFIILMVVWLVMFIPIAIILKLCRYDPLKRSYDSELKSYRVLRKTPLDKSSLETPF